MSTFTATALAGMFSLHGKRGSAGRVIAAHLGNGASLCAMAGGKSVDSTMGFTALDGLVMGTRCGAIDAGVVLYLLQTRGMTADDITALLYKQAGLLGVSGISADMRALLASPEAAAGEAVDLFTYTAARHAGALAATLGGLDGLVFTAGIGEHAPQIRAAICARLAWLGAKISAEANAANAPIISTADSRIEIRVIATDEEAMIARHCVAFI
jgi:acetate kinase